MVCEGVEIRRLGYTDIWERERESKRERQSIKKCVRESRKGGWSVCEEEYERMIVCV